MIWEKRFRKLHGMGDSKAMKDVRLDHKEKRAVIFIEILSRSRFPCTICGSSCGIHDTEGRN